VAAELNDKPFGISEPGLMAPSALDGSMDSSLDAELNRLAMDLNLDELHGLTLDEGTAGELRQMISAARMRRDEELLIRIERSLLRIERGQSMMLNLLQRLVHSARPVEAPSKTPRDERRRGRDKSEERK
jgi:hypothetical protein